MSQKGNKSLQSSQSSDTKSTASSGSRGESYENSRVSTPFPVLEPDLFYAPPVLMNDAEVASFIINGYLHRVNRIELFIIIKHVIFYFLISKDTTL